jgi:hypothetical protein
MKKNALMFFRAAIIGVVAVFIFSAVSIAFGILAVPQAHAYAVGSTAPTGITSGAGAAGLGGSSYDIGNSLQVLVSPFTGFLNNLKLNNNTTINPGGMGTTWPTVNMTPVVASSVQNILGQWIGEFDNWFYSVTGVQLSGILVVLLNLFSWALGLAQQAVNWLLGLFH